MQYSGIANQPDYDELIQSISGESSKAARQAINHSSITQIQKETGVTAIEQLTGIKGRRAVGLSHLEVLGLQTHPILTP